MNVGFYICESEKCLISELPKLYKGKFKFIANPPFTVIRTSE